MIRAVLVQEAVVLVSVQAEHVSVELAKLSRQSDPTQIKKAFAKIAKAFLNILKSIFLI